MGALSSGIISNSVSHTKCGKSIIGKKFRTNVAATLDFSDDRFELRVFNESGLDRPELTIFLNPIINSEIMFVVTGLTAARTPMGYWTYIEIKFLNNIEIEDVAIPKCGSGKHCNKFVSDNQLCIKGHYGVIVLGRCYKNFINIKGNMNDGYDYSRSATYDSAQIEMLTI